MAKVSELSGVFLSLGSNVGDRMGMLRAAMAEIDGHSKMCVTQPYGVAGVYETSPVGCEPGQPSFLNTAVGVKTELSAMALLGELLAIEAKLGRLRSSRNAPRLIDIDLLMYGREVCEGENLCLPHPRMHERRFVLEPLCEIAGDAVHPVLEKTISELVELARKNHPADALTRVHGAEALFIVS